MFKLENYKKKTLNDPVDQLASDIVRRTRITVALAAVTAAAVGTAKGLHHVYYELP